MQYKTCSTCQRTLPVDQFTTNKRSKDGFFYQCRECRKTRDHARHIADPEERARKAEKCRRRYESNPEYYRAIARTCWDRNRAKYNETSRRYTARLRREVLSAYSKGEPHCACCGETTYEFLTLDHVNNDGAEERKKLQNSQIIARLRREGFPPGYQVLCWNCNCAKQFYGICPHQAKKEATEEINALPKM